MQAPFAALRHRNFQLYLGGQLVSLAGTWMQNIAQGWLVYQISGSTVMLGVVGFAAAIPAFLIAPWAGVIVDRVNKRNLLVATQAVQMVLAFVLAFLTFTGLVQVWHVVVLAVLLGAVNSFDGPARQAFVVDMVGRDDLPNAIALNSMTFNAARVVGPAFGGILLATVGSAWCFAINGFSFLAVIFSLLAMKIPPMHKYHDKRSPWQQLKSGISYCDAPRGAARAAAARPVLQHLWHCLHDRAARLCRPDPQRRCDGLRLDHIGRRASGRSAVR